MECETMKILYLFIPGIIAILGNIVFYIIVKKRIDKSIEKYKISYSGIYKEKIEIHKELLKQLYGLKNKVQSYQYHGRKEIGEELFHDFNNFINYYIIHQPFIKKKILDGLKDFTKELRECFEDIYSHNSLNEFNEIDPEIRANLLKKFFVALGKFRKNEPFEQIENLIISEMKSDLRIEDI